MVVGQVNMEKIKKAYKKLKPKWKILDVGGGDQPIRMATHVIDIQPFNEVGRLGNMGRLTDKPRFTEDTWVQMNMCDGNWPFKDKEFDFVWCTQTLEDVRDPLTVCREMMRVGKAGYINTPAKLSELIFGMNPEPLSHFYNGYWHHRWLITREGNKIVFEPKHAYATSVRWADPELVDKIHKNPDLCIMEFYWDKDFEVEERFNINAQQSFDEIKQFIEGIKQGGEKDE